MYMHIFISYFWFQLLMLHVYVYISCVGFNFSHPQNNVNDTICNKEQTNI